MRKTLVSAKSANIPEQKGAESAARAGLPEAYWLNREKSKIMMMMKDGARGRKKGLFFIMTGNCWLS